EKFIRSQYGGVNEMVADENRFIEQCHAYFDGVLNPAEAQAFLSEVGTNPEYQQTFNQFQKEHQALKAYGEVEPSAGLADRIAQAVAEEPVPLRPVAVRGVGRSRWLFPVQAAAAILLVVGATIVFFQPQQMMKEPQSSSASAQKTFGEVAAP